MPSATGHIRAVLLDLFGTVVHFAPQVPTVEIAGTRWRSTMQWLRDTTAAVSPEVPFEGLLSALMHVTEELVRQREPDYFEVPSRERFRRALLRVGCSAEQVPVLAERLSLAHMDHLASTTLLPSGHAAALEALAARYRLGMISNFDHAATARRILAMHGIAERFEVILISDEFGRRKPHPAIFATALQHLGVRSEAALFVGDSLSEDLAGARNARLPFAWVNAAQIALPPELPAPRYIVGSLVELPALLADRP